jgi:hypothetical protein
VTTGKRQKELEGYVAQLDQFSLVDSFSHFVGFDVDAVIEELNSIFGPSFYSSISASDYTLGIDEVFSMVFPDGCDASRFNDKFFDAYLQSKYITTGYQHLSSEYLDSVPVTRRVPVPRIDLEVDTQKLVTDICISFSESNDLIEIFANFYSDPTAGITVKGVIATPYLDYAIREHVRVSIPAFTMDPSNRKSFICRIYSAKPSEDSEQHTTDLLKYLNQSVASYTAGSR